MEKLKFIIREANKLLGTTHNLLSFDALNCNQLLEYVSDILYTINASPKLKAGQDLSHTVQTILTTLQAIKYEPPLNIKPSDFYEGVISGDTNVIYPILEWTLINQDKIKKRAYVAKYADKLQIPAEAAEEPDVMSSYKNYERVMEEFWSSYKENVVTKRECTQAIEFKNDIKKMNQDLQNVIKRSQTQGEKLHNISNKENLIYEGKSFRGTSTEQRSLTKQITENLAFISHIEFKVKNLESKWSRRGQQSFSDVNIFQMVQEECRMNKVFLLTQLPQELDDKKDQITVMEESLENNCPSREQLLHSVNINKDAVQRFMTEKLNLYANTEDKLGPFRKQTSAISQKKLDEAAEVKSLKDTIAYIDGKIREREAILFTAVGGEILHGEELKHFIAVLREKSVFYKQLRSDLQSLSTELGVENRTFDVLKSIDSSIDIAYFDSHLTLEEENESSDTKSLVEAKQICKQIVHEIDIFKSDIAQIHVDLLSSKKEAGTVSQKLYEVTEVFQHATRGVLFEVQRVKQKIRENQKEIEVTEENWKGTVQSLNRLEHYFDGVIQDMISKSEEPASSESVCVADLRETKERHRETLADLQLKLKNLEEDKKREQTLIEFFKHSEYIIMQKIEETP